MAADVTPKPVDIGSINMIPNHPEQRKILHP